MLLHFGKIPIERTSILHISLKANPKNVKGSPFAEQQKVARKILGHPGLQGICVAPLRDTTRIIVFGLKNLVDPPSPHLEKLILDANLAIDSVAAQPDHISVESAVKFTFYYWMEVAGYVKVGDSLMLRDLLFSSSKHEGIPQISFNINVSPIYEIDISFMARMVRISILEEWFVEQNAEMQGRWVVVLPKLGRGRVVGAHRALPAHSPFSSYNEIKTYWRDSYGYDLPARTPDCYYDIKFNGMKNTFLYPYFLVWCNQPEAVHFKDPVESEKAMCLELRTSVKDICEGRLLAGLQIHIREKHGEVHKVSASIVSLQPNRLRGVPKLGPFRPNAPYKRPIIDASIKEDKSEEELPSLNMNLPQKLTTIEKPNSDEESEDMDEYKAHPSESCENLLQNLRPRYSCPKTSFAQVAKNLGKKRNIDMEVKSEIEPAIKKQPLINFKEEKPTFSGLSTSMQLPPSAPQFSTGILKNLMTPIPGKKHLRANVYDYASPSASHTLSSQSRRVILSDGIDPVNATQRKTPRRLPNIDFSQQH